MTAPRSLAELMAEKTIILEGADNLTKEGFTQVPNFVLKSKDISSNAKLVYAGLLSYAWHNNYCFPGQERLSRDLGLGERTVNRAIQELSKQNFIDVKRQGLGKPNVYTLKQLIQNVDK